MAYRLIKKGWCSLYKDLWLYMVTSVEKCITFLMSSSSVMDTQQVLDNLTRLNIYCASFNLNWKKCLTQRNLKITLNWLFLNYFQFCPHFIIKPLGSTLNNIRVAWKFNHYQKQSSSNPWRPRGLTNQLDKNLNPQKAYAKNRVYCPRKEVRQFLHGDKQNS